jgi:hypothetical protein
MKARQFKSAKQQSRGSNYDTTPSGLRRRQSTHYTVESTSTTERETAFTKQKMSVSCSFLSAVAPISILVKSLARKKERRRRRRTPIFLTTQQENPPFSVSCPHLSIIPLNFRRLR